MIVAVAGIVTVSQHYLIVVVVFYCNISNDYNNGSSKSNGPDNGNAGDNGNSVRGSDSDGLAIVVVVSKILTAAAAKMSSNGSCNNGGIGKKR